MGFARKKIFLLSEKFCMSCLLSGIRSIPVLINKTKVTDYVITGVAMVTLTGNNPALLLITA